MKKEHLQKLLVLISEIVKDSRNEWFSIELAKLFNRANIPGVKSDVDKIEHRIIQVQKYLQINFDDLVDYSAFEEPSREQLTRDCIEMCRYKSGTPNHKVDFAEFCRYAHLQIEEMFNYYLNKISNRDIGKIYEFILMNNEWYANNQKEKNLPRPKHIHHIGYLIKFHVFRTICIFDHEVNNTVTYLNQFRNESSHRDSLSKIEEDNTLRKYNELGLHYPKKIILKSEEPPKKLIDSAKFIIWKRSQNFNVIYLCIEDIKSKILSLPHSI